MHTVCAQVEKEKQHPLKEIKRIEGGELKLHHYCNLISKIFVLKNSSTTIYT